MDFVLITSTPSPSPQFGQLVPLFLTPMYQKFCQGFPHPHPQIDPIYSLWKVDKKFGQGPPPSFGQNPKEQLLFFRETVSKRDQAPLSHVYGEIWPHSTQFWLWFLEPFRYNKSIQWDIFIEDTWTGTDKRDLNAFLRAWRKRIFQWLKLWLWWCHF